MKVFKAASLLESGAIFAMSLTIFSIKKSTAAVEKSAVLLYNKVNIAKKNLNMGEKICLL